MPVYLFVYICLVFIQVLSKVDMTIRFTILQCLQNKRKPLQRANRPTDIGDYYKRYCGIK